MAPKSGSNKHFRTLGIDEQITQLQQRADKLQQKHMHKAISSLLQERPELMPGIVRHLQSKGVHLPEVKVLGKKRSSTEVDMESDCGLNAGTGEDYGQAAGAPPAKVRKTAGIIDTNVENWLPHKYTRLDATSPGILEALASSLQDISFSKYMLKALKTKGMNACHYAEKICEVIEFDTGFDTHQQVTGENRHLPTLTANLKAMSSARNRRGKNLRLPADWATAGVYKLSMHGDGPLLVTHRFNNLIAEVPDSMRLKDKTNEMVPFGSLRIALNHSETKAAIVADKVIESILIASFGLLGDPSCNVGDGDGVAAEGGKVKGRESSQGHPSSPSKPKPSPVKVKLYQAPRSSTGTPEKRSAGTP